MKKISILKISIFMVGAVWAIICKLTEFFGNKL